MLCVLTKEKLCKQVAFKFYKVKNDNPLANRQYVLRANYSVDGKNHKVDLPLDVRWAQLTRNDAGSFKGVNGYLIKQVMNYIEVYNVMNTGYYVQ